ncbi:hypothetical protein [Paraburkholderia fungorum]|uniref:hypothetical protein n=1 Tax=Paraburkholderia fungorum TaxID=134537 RepID=UPI0015B3CB21|nr:hypothetical protein [Paraburkholderia fungorum]
MRAAFLIRIANRLATYVPVVATRTRPRIDPPRSEGLREMCQFGTPLYQFDTGVTRAKTNAAKRSISRRMTPMSGTDVAWQ